MRNKFALKPGQKKYTITHERGAHKCYIVFRENKKTGKVTFCWFRGGCKKFSLAQAIKHWAVPHGTDFSARVLMNNQALVALADGLRYLDQRAYRNWKRIRLAKARLRA